MTINLNVPDIRELKPRITVFGVGGAGGNAVNNMITAGLQGVEFVVANTDAQALTMSKAQRIVQMGTQVTQGLGAGSQPDVGAAAAQEVIDELRDHLSGANMVFVTAGMGGGTGTVELATRILNRPVRIGRPLGFGRLPSEAKSASFAVPAGLLVYPQYAHLEHVEPRHTRQLRTGTDGYFGRVGRWLREGF